MSRGPEKIVFTNSNDEEIELNANWGVCPRCSGDGVIVNPSIDGDGIPASEFRDDPEFERDYFGGVYDIPCPECKGRRVVAVASEYTNSKEDLEAYKKHLQDEAEYEAMCRAERRMGC